MEKLVNNYLRKNYDIDFNFYESCEFRYIGENKYYYKVDIINELYLIFNLDDSILIEIFDKWAVEQEVIYNNRIVGVMEKLYSLGISIPTKDSI